MSNGVRILTFRVTTQSAQVKLTNYLPALPEDLLVLMGAEQYYRGLVPP